MKDKMVFTKPRNISQNLNAVILQRAELTTSIGYFVFEDVSVPNLFEFLEHIHFKYQKSI